MTTEYRKANAAFPDQAELNRRLTACPEPTAKRKIWLAAEWLFAMIAIAAGALIMAGIFGALDKLLMP